MKLSELSPAPGSVRKSFRVGRGNGSGAGKTAGKGTRARRPAPAAVSVRALKAARCPFSAGFPRGDL